LQPCFVTAWAQDVHIPEARHLGCHIAVQHR
jgi:hypothetical protein